ncbi:MAG: hypothetical protein D4R64_14900 [Porphyromonadaceae bacterium]|nr:MAG: hypothetical protein D4R64_14900 [Porphyromonadaceae bacterium]
MRECRVNGENGLKLVVDVGRYRELRAFRGRSMCRPGKVFKNAFRQNQKNREQELDHRHPHIPKTDHH